MKDLKHLTCQVPFYVAFQVNYEKNFQTSRKCDLKSQQPSTNPENDVWTLEFQCLKFMVTHRARINSWIELELIINSIQFSMNWIGIELKDFELELNWNWKPQLIGIDQFIFNSTPHFTRLNFFVCHIMEIVVWQAIPCEQAYPNAPLCVPSMWSVGVFGHQGMTNDHYINY